MVEQELSWCESGWHGHRLRSAAESAVAAGAPLARALHEQAYVITGGLGGLGLRAAELLVRRASSRVVLTSRSGRVASSGQGRGHQARSLYAVGDGGVRVLACDVADCADTRAVVACAVA